MALSKQVKVGGSHYQGDTLTVDAGAADYVLDFTFSVAGAANAMTVVPSAYGAGDSIGVEHLDASDAVVKTLAEAIPNVGALAAWKFDFPALEKFLAGHKLRVTYTNAAGVAMTVYAVVEDIR